MFKYIQTYFRNRVVFTPQDFLSIFGHFFNILHESVKSNVHNLS